MALFADHIRRGTRANQPAASAVPVATIYHVTDERVTELSDGTSWQDISDGGTGGGSGAVDVVIVKQSDEAVQSASVLQSDDVFVFQVGANEAWIFEILAFVSTDTSTIPDFRFGFTVPAGSSLRWYATNLESGATNIHHLQYHYGGNASTIGSGGVVSSAVIPHTPFLIKGSVRSGGVPGAVQFQWSQLAASATSTVVREGSYLRATRVA